MAANGGKCAAAKGDKLRQIATNCDKFVAAFCRNLTLVRMRLDSLAEWLRGWCLPKIARR
jgi:hypothetical protein